MGVKLRMTWENVQGDDCRVDFDYVDYIDEPQVIYGGPRPFVLSEYNSDDDIFKPIRPMIATIEILASAAGVKMEDFLADNDTDITVKFYLGSWNYWNGYLSQEDIEETWIATNHIITLRAYEGIGVLKDIMFADGDNILVGTYTPLQIINHAKNETIGSLVGARIISNLFHTSMSSASSQTGLDQCKIDARTFQNDTNDFEDKLTVLEKILKSWNMTMFQWQGIWNLVRIPEYFTSGNLYGFINNSLGRIYEERRWDIEAGVNESVKPVMPEMLKRLNKPSKETTIKFQWEYRNPIIQNESWLDGEFIDEVSAGVIGYELSKVAGSEVFVPIYGNRKNYTINNWDKLNYSFPYTPSTAPMGRAEIYRNDVLESNVCYIGGAGNTTDQALKAESFKLAQGDVITIRVKVNTWDYYFTNDQLGVIQVQFEKNPVVGEDTLIKNLNMNGEWSDGQVLFAEWGVSEQSSTTKEIEVTSEPCPYGGELRIYLLNFLAFDRSITVQPSQQVWFRDFEVEVRPLERNNNRIAGGYDRYTIQRDIVKNFEDVSWLDDKDNSLYKGAILQSDGTTLTGDQWYRRRTFNNTSATSERLTFKRHSALAHWFINRSYKTKIDANFFGLKWDAGGFDQPIGLINTIKFVDDAPTKIYMIANLKEIDFMACTWSATLFEIYDTDVEDNEPTDLDVHSFDIYYG